MDSDYGHLVIQILVSSITAVTSLLYNKYANICAAHMNTVVLHELPHAR